MSPLRLWEISYVHRLLIFMMGTENRGAIAGCLRICRTGG